MRGVMIWRSVKTPPARVVAVFPANVHMAIHPDEFPDVPGGRLSLYARLPFQGVFVAWVVSAMRR